ncbi:peptidase S8 and S53 subtilisin kexin sedolisin [Listeria weihenstephanensis FSL R9-0317]|uniref:S8 family serine peptidase n=1 Tax=Listeria weihenstephanensis TaxID=1006155 RepID=UPI0003E87D1E|nr:S8 family serine peptidase [Listeria weihenstephanensis]EUJ38930.1 peptidase S8 and S53 subtilisin kexin sedolisin [Listeria weihenstephanensis FSL R9-0317]
MKNTAKICFIVLFTIIIFQTPLSVFASKIVQSDREVNQSDEAGSIDSYYKENVTGKNIKIAILDTGIDKSNRDLTFKKGINFTTNNAADFSDKNGHGTKIAGIIGARKNGEGLIGIAPNSELYIAKVANDSGKVGFDDVVKGLNWAIDQKVDIINISLEFGKGNSELKQAINNAIENNIIVIASSGNIRAEGDTFKAYPGAYPNVISVGMLNLQGQIYADEFKEKKVDVYAPGEDLTSTYFDNKLTLDTGVSYATAYASGFAALVMEGKQKAGEKVSHDTVLKTMKADLNQGIDGATWYVYIGLILNIATVCAFVCLAIYSLISYQKSLPKKWPTKILLTALIIIVIVNIVGRAFVYFMST